MAVGTGWRRAACVAVPVANVWNGPQAARPVDEPCLRPRPDMGAWCAAMTLEDRLGLRGRLETQVLMGEIVVVAGERDGWAEVMVSDQPSRKSPAGYPGWVRSEHLCAPGATGTSTATIARPLVRARAQAGGEVVLSFGARLSVEAPGGNEALLRSPTGDLMSVPVDALAAAAAEGGAIVASARSFTGLAYLWGGCSGFGLDCSGLVHLVHRAAGVTVARDAEDQARGGLCVPVEQARPGDLLFFSRAGEEPRHVALCSGPGLMLHSPRTGRDVGEESQADEPYASERAPMARRYTGSGPASGPGT